MTGIRGFTLVEILVASTLLFICITISTMCFNAGSRNFARSQETIEACKYCYELLEMIETELREADPETLNVSATSVSFAKFHKPANETQFVTWSYNNKKARRTFLSASVLSPGSFEFGENIENLSFSNTIRTSTAGNKFILVKISIKVKGKIQSDGGGRRDIVELEKEVCLRRQPNFKAKVTIISPSVK